MLLVSTTCDYLRLPLTIHYYYPLPTLIRQSNGSLLRRLRLLRRLMRTPTRIIENSYAQYCAWYTTLHQVLLPHLVILLPTHTPSPTVTTMITFTTHSYENATSKRQTCQQAGDIMSASSRHSVSKLATQCQRASDNMSASKRQN